MTAYSAYLRIRHPSIDPDEISRTLDLQPLHAWAAGSMRRTAGSDVPRGARSDTYWLGELQITDPYSAVVEPWFPARVPGDAAVLAQLVPPGALLAAQVRRLQAHQEFFDRVTAERGTCDLVLSLGGAESPAIELPPTLLRALADLHVTLSLELANDRETNA